MEDQQPKIWGFSKETAETLKRMAEREQSAGDLAKDELQVTVKQIELVATKLCLEAGDVLVLSYPHRMRPGDAERIQQSVQEAFGVHAIVLREGLKIDGVLSIAPSLVEEAARAKARKESNDEQLRALMQCARATKEVPVASVSYVDENGERQTSPSEGERMMQFFKEGGER